jgi:hypothetical protein
MIRAITCLAIISTSLCISCVTSDVDRPEIGGPVVTVEDFHEKIVGAWEGDYSLWLRPGVDAEKSKFRADVRPAAGGAFVLLSYCWSRGDKEQEGIFLLGGAGDKATMTWGDSFHMKPEPMQCEGRLEKDCRLIFDGSYSGGPDMPEWGWRTEFALQGAGGLLMEAYNITPDGQEALAVRAEMKRSG